MALEHTRWEDFDYTYLDELSGNPMGWLGNGYTIADYNGSSRTTYLDPTIIDYPPVPKPFVVADGVRKVESIMQDDGKLAGVNVHIDNVDINVTIA